MIRTVEIKTMEEVMGLIMDQQRNEEIGRLRSTYYYRGMRNADFRILTSLYRNCKGHQRELEGNILENFTKYASMEDPTLKDSVWRQLIIGQHHGLPTRLLDWTYSPLIALNFANEEESLDRLTKHDSVVWRIDARDTNRSLPQEYLAALHERNARVFTIEALSDLAGTLEKYDADMKGRSMVILEPPSVDQRIITQFSLFSVVPMGMDSIEDFLEHETESTVRYVIRRELKWDIRDLLDQLNISERVIYPGIDGITRWIARHYFVR